jgi:hypothetical protein
MRTGFIGYTYQQQVTLLLLSIMDVERNISRIEIEAETNDNFEDLILSTDSKCYQLQIKDYEKVLVTDLKFNSTQIFIKGKLHKLSTMHNVIVFKYIDIAPNDTILNFPSYRLSKNISLVSLSRVQIDKEIERLYIDNSQRKNEIDSFLNSLLDKRIWDISIESLPQLKIFITELQEKSVVIAHKLLEFKSILFIESKPGVGKSHFVNTLIKENKNHIVYRFWIGSQDRDYQERLKFRNFIRDLTTKLFQNQKPRDIEEILSKLKSERKVFIIDGLDHVQNYNKADFEQFIEFIDKAKEKCKVLVLSRPLTTKLKWEKYLLDNWNLEQTKKVLDQLFHISKYSVVDKIYKISKGYPIIVKYLAEHYKIHKTIPILEQVNNINAYYKQIIDNEKGLHSLSLFLCCSSYIMKSEIEQFVGDEKDYINEFVNEHPYLFDIKLNRVSLFHDSFNTFLRKQVNYKSKSEKAAKIVIESILNLEKRFLSRFIFFQLSLEQKKKILAKYSSINTFERLLRNTIDFESIASFYGQLRETLLEFSPNFLRVTDYYELSLIFNLVVREHLSTINTFYYTYVQSLIANGVTQEEITSSDYLFGMFYYVKTKNASLLLNRTAIDLYGIDHFHNELQFDVITEKNYIEKHSKKLRKSTIATELKNRVKFRENLTHSIENIFIHQLKIKGFEVLRTSFETFLAGDRRGAAYELENFLIKYDVPEYYSNWILQDVFDNLISYGYKIDNGKNENHDLSLKELIHTYRNLGSFKLLVKIHNYIRLALLENRPIDIGSICYYWTKFYQRKDYTLYGVPVALKTLQSERLISLEECVNLIIKIQEMSEKGYRHLLSEFIEHFPPSKIIPFLEKNFDIERLRINWFMLSTKYINKLSDNTFNIEKNRLIRYHRTASIPIEEIENVLYSKRFIELKVFLTMFNSRISYKAFQSKIVKKFEHTQLPFEKIGEQYDEKVHRHDSLPRFDKGILTCKDLSFIKRKKLKAYEIAKFSDGDYGSLPELEIFKFYTAKEMSRDLGKILYYSITGRTKGASYFYYLFYHPGNMLSLIKCYRSDKEFKLATKSFQKFINLSMFDMNLK